VPCQPWRKSRSCSSHLWPAHNDIRLTGAHQFGLGKHEYDNAVVSLASADALSTAVPPGLPPDVLPADTVAATAPQSLVVVAQGNHAPCVRSTAAIPFTPASVLSWSSHGREHSQDRQVMESTAPISRISGIAGPHFSHSTFVLECGTSTNL
jgi:hypothetical protein